MNDALQQMYMKPAVSSTNDGELIDISSDEESQENSSAIAGTTKQKVLCTTNNVTITKIVGDSSNTNGDKVTNDAIPTLSGSRMPRPGQQVYLKLKQPTGISNANDQQNKNTHKNINIQDHQKRQH